MCALAAHQSRLPSHAGGEALQFLGEFLEFGFLFEPDDRFSRTDPDSRQRANSDGRNLVLALVGLLLTGVGLASKHEVRVGSESRSDEGTEHAILPEPPTWLWVSGGLIALVGILSLGGCSYLWGGKRTGAILATILIPPALLFADLLLRRYWPRLHGKALDMGMELPGGLMSLSGPLRRRAHHDDPRRLDRSIPLFASRGALLFTPYLVVTASRGLVSLVRRGPAWLVLGVVVAAAHVLSVDLFITYRPLSIRDYKALAQELTNRVKETDLIFVRGKHLANDTDLLLPQSGSLSLRRQRIIPRRSPLGPTPASGPSTWDRR